MTKLKTRLAVLLLSTLCLLTYAAGQITPLGDAYINSADATTNYGAKTLLDVDGATQITYIQFNLASIPSGASVSEATLKVYVNTVVTAGSFNVDYVNGAWSESTINYNNAPALGSTIVSGVSLTTADKNQYILVNITSAVQAWLSGSQTNDGIALVADGSFDATFDSKESTSTSHPAELDIVFAGDGTITGVTTASDSGLMGGGTSGTLNLSLLNTCAANQVLQWSGSAWKCSSAGSGTVTSVGSGAGLTGGPITGSGTLSIPAGGVTNAMLANSSLTVASGAGLSGGSSVALGGTVTLSLATSTCASGNALVALPFTCLPFATLGANVFSGSQTINADLALPNTSSATVGVITFGGKSFLHNYGTNNTFLGAGAGNVSMTGAGANTAVGTSALAANTTGVNDTAVGASALAANTTATGNSAFGFSALILDTTGVQNSAFGGFTLATNTAGDYNSAFGYATLNADTGNNNSGFGYAALYKNTSGIQNEAFGYEALFTNTTGNGNAAFGTGALNANTTGGSSGTTGGNSAFGNFALLANTTAGGNSAFGYSALTANTTGTNNTAVGSAALAKLTTGTGNVAVGLGAGGNLDAAESNDIYIGNSGIAGESDAIRISFIGTQTTAYMAGISGATSASGVAVFVNGAGQLGTITSSRRFKHQIADMGAESDVLMKLRPVAFYYKPELDDTQTRQYGLVAEEVAQIAPQLVVFDKDGKPETVRYHFVNAMLLNEVQKQRQIVEEEQKKNEEQNDTIARQQEEIQDLAARVAKLEALLTAKR